MVSAKKPLKIYDEKEESMNDRERFIEYICETMKRAKNSGSDFVASAIYICARKALLDKVLNADNVSAHDALGILFDHKEARCTALMYAALIGEPFEPLENKTEEIEEGEGKETEKDKRDEPAIFSFNFMKILGILKKRKREGETTPADTVPWRNRSAQRPYKPKAPGSSPGGTILRY